jgi:hypothetical protein
MVLLHRMGLGANVNEPLRKGIASPESDVIRSPP